MTYWHPDDYDDEGNLKAPWWFWLILLYLLKEWGVVAAGMMAHSVTISEWIVSGGWSMLCPGFLALLCGCLYPLRGRNQGIAKATFILLLSVVLLALVLNVVVGLSAWWDASPELTLQVSLGCFSFACLLMCTCSTRLYAVFLIK